MKRILLGQTLLILCCAVYLVWWYRGYRPGVSVNRVGGLNGILFLITVALGLAGLVCSLGRPEAKAAPRLNGYAVAICGVLLYFALMVLTRTLFGRVVTTELFLIVGWTVLEVTAVNRLCAAGFLSGRGFVFLCGVIAAAFAVSIVLYVAYYRMEEMRAFYAAMIPLVTEAAAMAAVTAAVLLRK